VPSVRTTTSAAATRSSRQGSFRNTGPADVPPPTSIARDATQPWLARNSTGTHRVSLRYWPWCRSRMRVPFRAGSTNNDRDDEWPGHHHRYWPLSALRSGVIPEHWPMRANCHRYILRTSRNRAMRRWPARRHGMSRSPIVGAPTPIFRRRRRPRVLAGALTGLLHRRKRRTVGDLPRRRPGGHSPRPRPAGDAPGVAPFHYPDEPESEGGIGVREPRPPKPSGLSGAEALPLPRSDDDA
jgi:hypothetical protein